MKNKNQKTNFDSILDTSKIQLIDKLVQKNLKGGIGSCPPPIEDEI